MQTNNIMSSLPTTPVVLSKINDKIQNKPKTSQTDIQDKIELNSNATSVEQAPRKKGYFSLSRILKRGAIGAAAGAAALALSGGGILATAAVGAAVWGIVGAGIGAVGGALAGRMVGQAGAGAGVGAATGGLAGVAGGAFKGAILGGIAGLLGGNPIGGAIAGGALSMLGI
ncbi:MAG: hypothetical protein ACLFQV_12535 [Vulcanimicrobiota bacterium]